MKFLLDLLPLLLFFAVFKSAQSQPEAAAAWAQDHFGFLIAGGVISPSVAPVLLATVVVVLATCAQVLVLLLRRQKVDPLLWVSLVLVVVLGGATVYFHSDTFIKWKPTVLWGVMAAVFALSPLLGGRNWVAHMLGQQVQLPPAVWQRLNTAWVVFFASMAALNWAVFTWFSTETWVTFKLFGSMGLMLLFILAQGVFISRHAQESPSP